MAWFNKQWRDFTGSKPELTALESWFESVHPDEIALCRATVTKAFESQQSFGAEYRLKHADATCRWIADKGSPSYSDSGVFTGFIGSCSEIQQCKQLESTLAEESELFSGCNSKTRRYQARLKL